MLVQLANALKDSGAYTEADQVYCRALDLMPDQHADIYLQRGHLMKLMGDIDRAVEYYSISTTIDPSLIDSRRELEDLLPSITILNENPVIEEVITELMFSDVELPPFVEINYRRIVNQYRWRRG